MPHQNSMMYEAYISQCLWGFQFIQKGQGETVFLVTYSLSLKKVIFQAKRFFLFLLTNSNENLLMMSIFLLSKDFKWFYKTNFQVRRIILYRPLEERKNQVCMWSRRGIYIVCFPRRKIFYWLFWRFMHTTYISHLASFLDPSQGKVLIFWEGH